ncbi:putative Transmembrane protein [Quillaja saponaria]|uniref:Transmembrane protein n=1 Tax=Quillaja saponaria TaxID=32244 RepID=A0AAD7PIW0_QUISA|nr:putative Transmembrane protein [Quillaja saponaria]
MSSLQQRSLPPLEGGIWKVRTNDLETEEIIRERRAAIETGKLKGRRLFEPLERETGMGFVGIEDCEVWSVSFCDSDNEHDQQDDSNGSKDSPAVCFQCCYSSASSSSSPCVSGEIFEEKEQEAGEGRILGRIEEKRVSGNGGRHYMVFLVGLAIASIIFAICITKVRSIGGYQNEVIIVPT